MEAIALVVCGGAAGHCSTALLGRNPFGMQGDNVRRGLRWVILPT